MIVYYKLANILKERNMKWKDLCKAGISVNMPARFTQNKILNTETIDKVCEYLQVQPCEIMEWIPNAEYEKQNAKKIAIEEQIAKLQEELKNIDM